MEEGSSWLQKSFPVRKPAFFGEKNHSLGRKPVVSSEEKIISREETMGF
jgi:hypothetical protein